MRIKFKGLKSRFFEEMKDDPCKNGFFEEMKDVQKWAFLKR